MGDCFVAKTGAELSARFWLVRELSRDGGGSLWEAEDGTLRSIRVAVRLLEAARSLSGPAAEAFREEAGRLTRLDHRNLVNVRSFDCHEGLPYLVLLAAPGDDLAADLERRRRFPLAEVQDVTRQAAAGLDHAHGKGVLHRDVRPANLRAEKDGTRRAVRLTGFAFSCDLDRLRAGGSSPADLDALAYLAPEVLAGGPATRRSDVYSLAATSYALLAGHPPLTGEGGPEPLAALEGGAARQVLDYVNGALLQGLSKEPAARPETCGEFLRAFSGEVRVAPPPRVEVKAPSPAATAAPVATPVAHAAGEQMTDPLGVQLAWIPAGRFTMGSPPEERGRLEREGPRRVVTLSRGFWMGVHQVTQAEWRAVMGTNPSTFEGERRPVENVSWDDAADFCRKVAARAGAAYRLPTEAEWEYACRAGSDAPLPPVVVRGSWFARLRGRAGTFALPLDDLAWHGGNSGGETHDVGQKRPNAWGLHDTLGNVWEWCLDWYGPYVTGAAQDPTGPASGSFRVDRGGSWQCSVPLCRCAGRDSSAPALRRRNLGFRVVREG